jgi:hypothetical protein
MNKETSSPVPLPKERLPNLSLMAFKPVPSFRVGRFLVVQDTVGHRKSRHPKRVIFPVDALAMDIAQKTDEDGLTWLQKSAERDNFYW